jgi:chemosensory pili system protein ChpA (sensor histidine kinase/response regulator)
VGLDVVKEWVYRRYGDFSVETGAEGTSFNLSIPLQSESMIVMVVRQAGQHYAIDIARVQEIKDAADDALSLASVLGVESSNLSGETAQPVKPVICCQSQEGTLHLEVDEIVGRKTVKFNTNDRILNASDLYQGFGLMDNRHVVLRLNTDNFSRYASVKQVVQAPPPDRSSVLIVDDSVTIRASFGRAMQTAGYNIVLARNGLEAMEYLETHQPEVIILDLEMPLMDGYELGTYIRNEPRLSRCALVVVSSKPKSVVGEWLTAVNADAYYEKPCSESVIAGVVAGLV